MGEIPTPFPFKFVFTDFDVGVFMFLEFKQMEVGIKGRIKLKRKWFERNTSFKIVLTGPFGIRVD